MGCYLVNRVVKPEGVHVLPFSFNHVFRNSFYTKGQEDNKEPETRYFSLGSWTPVRTFSELELPNQLLCPVLCTLGQTRT